MTDGHAWGAVFVSTVGICQWCGVWGPLTRDHIKTKPERAELKALGWRKQHFPIVWACGPCNHKRGATPVEEWRAMLLSERGWIYTAQRHFARRSLKAKAICTLEGGGEIGLHRCAAWMPCGVLRESVVCVGLGLDVIASYIYQETMERHRRGPLWSTKGVVARRT